MTNPEQFQLDKFKVSALKHQADEDETRWEERLRKIAKLEKRN